MLKRNREQTQSGSIVKGKRERTLLRGGAITDPDFEQIYYDTVYPAANENEEVEDLKLRGVVEHFRGSRTVVSFPITTLYPPGSGRTETLTETEFFSLMANISIGNRVYIRIATQNPDGSLEFAARTLSRGLFDFHGWNADEAKDLRDSPYFRRIHRRFVLGEIWDEEEDDAPEDEWGGSDKWIAFGEGKRPVQVQFKILIPKGDQYIRAHRTIPPLDPNNLPSFEPVQWPFEDSQPVDFLSQLAPVAPPATPWFSPPSVTPFLVPSSDPQTARAVPSWPKPRTRKQRRRSPSPVDEEEEERFRNAILEDADADIQDAPILSSNLSTQEFDTGVDPVGAFEDFLRGEQVPAPVRPVERAIVPQVPIPGRALLPTPSAPLLPTPQFFRPPTPYLLPHPSPLLPSPFSQNLPQGMTPNSQPLLQNTPNNNWNYWLTRNKTDPSRTRHAGQNARSTYHHNRKMGFYPYLNDSCFDLSRAQIFAADGSDFSTEEYQVDEKGYNLAKPPTFRQTTRSSKGKQNCLVYALELAGIPKKSIRQAVTQYLENGKTEIPANRLKKIAECLQLQFAICSLTDEKAGMRTRLTYYPKKNEANWPVINLGKISDHIFLNEVFTQFKGENGQQRFLECIRRKERVYAEAGTFTWKNKATRPSGFTTVYVIQLLKERNFLQTVRLDYETLKEKGGVEQDSFNDPLVKTLMKKVQQTPVEKEKLFFDNIDYQAQSECTIRETKFKPSVFFFAGDCEAVTREGMAHEIYLLGLTPVPEYGAPNFRDPQEVKIWEGRYAASEMVQYLVEAFDEVIRTKLNSLSSIQKTERVRQRWRKKNALVEVYIFFHNLRYDRALLQKELVLTHVLEKNGSLYEFRIQPSDSISIIFRDSRKHFAGKVKDMPSTYGLDPRLQKQEKGVFYDYFSPDKRDQLVPVSQYILSRPCNLTAEDAEREVYEACDLLGIAIQDQQFNPDELYREYLRYDVLVLAFGLRSIAEGYRAVLEECKCNSMDDFAGNNSLKMMTSSSFGKKVASYFGCFEKVFESGSNLRSYIMKSVRGGRCLVHPTHEGKAVQGTFAYFDAVSLYPSAMKYQQLLAGGFPTGPAKQITPENLTIEFLNSPQVFYAVVTVEITAIPKKLVYVPPIISYKDKEGILRYTQDLPDGEPLVVTLGLLDLQDYIRLHRIEFNIVCGVYWDGEPNPKLGDIAELLHQVRKKFKKGGAEPNEAKSSAVKLVANSIYGGTIQTKSFKELVLYEKATTDYLLKIYNRFGEVLEWQDLGKVIQVGFFKADESKMPCIIGSLILSRARWIMNNLWQSCEESQSCIYYTDTDSVIIPIEKLFFIQKKFQEITGGNLIGTELGQFHCDFDKGNFGEQWQKSFDDSQIFSELSFLIRKKVYLHCATYNISPEKSIHAIQCRMKGIPQAGLFWLAKYFKEPNAWKGRYPKYKDPLQRNLIHFYRLLSEGFELQIPLNANATEPETFFTKDHQGVQLVFPEATRGRALFYFNKNRTVYTSCRVVYRTVKKD